MKYLLTFLLLISAEFIYAQDTVNTKFRKIYIGAGLGFGYGNKKPLIAMNANISANIYKSIQLSSRYYRLSSAEEARDEIDDFSFQIGMRKKNFIISGGPSLIRYFEPVDIDRNFYNSITFDYKRHDYFGIAIRSDFEVPISKKIGTALGVFANINPGYSFGGIYFNFLLGRLKL
jgi:hypothetical protein